MKSTRLKHRKAYTEMTAAELAEATRQFDQEFAFEKTRALTVQDKKRHRFGEKSTTLNGRMGPRQLRKHCQIDELGERLLKQALTELGLSARAHDKILRVARTIADLAGEERIRPDHITEAIMYRRLDRQL